MSTVKIHGKKVKISEERGLFTNEGWVTNAGDDSLFIGVYEYENEDWYVAEYIEESVKGKFKLFKKLVKQAMESTGHV